MDQTDSQPPSAQDEARSAAEPATRAVRRGWLRRLVVSVLSGVVVLVGVLAVLLAVLLLPIGTRFVLDHVPGLRVVQPKGSLLRNFTAQKIEFNMSGSATLPKVVIEDFAWLGFHFEHASAASSGWGAALETLSARSVSVDLPPSTPSTEPAKMPSSLALPLGVRIAEIRVGSLRVSSLGAEPVTDLRARLIAQHRVGMQVLHRIDSLSLHWNHWSASGAAGVAVKSPFALDAALALQSDAALQKLPGNSKVLDNRVQAHLKIGGSLARVLAQADAQARDQHLRASAVFAPFADSPIQSAAVDAKDFNLALLDARAPQTLLSGQLQVGAVVDKTKGVVEPMLALRGQWRNDAAGRWNEGRVPAQSIQLAGQVAARDGLIGHLDQLDVGFGAVKQSGGRLQATGQWSLRHCADAAACAKVGPAWALSAKLEQLRLAALDASAPPLLISGPVDLRGDAPLSARLNIAAELTGRVDDKGRDQSVLVKVLADVAPNDIQLHALKAQAGAATLSLSGSARQQDQAWRVQAKGQWGRFDPQLWWPAWFGGASVAPAASNNDLNGQLDADLHWRPADANSATRDALAELLSTLNGEAHVLLDHSRLQGVPVAARVDLTTPARSAVVKVDAAFDLADNHLVVKGALDQARTSRDAWDASIDWRDLRSIAPIAQLLGVKNLQGAVAGKVSGSGRWPALKTGGDVQAKGVAVGWLAPSTAPVAAQGAKPSGVQSPMQSEVHQLGLDSLSAHWQWGSAWADETASVQTQIDLDHLRLGVWRVDRLNASTTGTVHDHHAALTFDAVLPPGLAASLQPVLKRRNADADLKVTGQFDVQGQGRIDERHAAWSWRGQWQRMLVQPEAASVVGNLLGDQPWLRVEPFETRLVHDAAHTEFTATPTRLGVVGGTVTLRQLHWASAPLGQNGPGGIDAEATVEPIQIARVMAALQPDMGWSGDLAVGGLLRLHRGAGEHAPVALDAEVARSGGGDLSLTDAAVDGGAVQHLRLESLRVALSARDGVWKLDQQLSGRRFGSLTGQLVATTDPAALWPEGHAPLDGELNLNVANLRLWGIWVPAGWRLAGQLQGHAAFKGSIEQPQVHGYLKGNQLGVSNVIEGVEFDQGELDFEADGAQAKLNRLTLRAGQGDLTLTGDARFDTEPEAHLRLALHRFAVLQRIDRRLVVSGQADMAMRVENISVQGAFAVDEGLFDISKSGAPTLDDDVRIAGVDDVVEEGGDAASRKGLHKVNLDVQLDLGSKLRLRGYGLDTKLVGQLKLNGGPPTYRPSLRGTVRTEAGTFAAYGQKLVINRGAINFIGPIDNPNLDIEATRRMTSNASLTASVVDPDVRVGVTITGTAQNPRIRLFSDPEMSDTDKLSWLILGHASSGVAGADLAMLQGAASALISGDSSGANEGLLQAFGIDDLSLRQSNDSTHETMFSVGKQLSQRWYLGYERGLNATTGTWQLIYRLAQSFTLRAQSGLDNSLDFIWVWRWN